MDLIFLAFVKDAMDDDRLYDEGLYYEEWEPESYYETLLRQYSVLYENCIVVNLTHKYLWIDKACKDMISSMTEEAMAELLKVVTVNEFEKMHSFMFDRFLTQ